MTTASANALLEIPEKEITVRPRRGKIAKALGMHALGRTVKKAVAKAGSFIKERPAVPASVGTVLMVAGMLTAGSSLMDAGRQMSNQVGDSLFAIVAPEGTPVEIRSADFQGTTTPLGGGAASFLVGGALLAYGMRSSRQRGAAVDENWAQGLRGTPSQEAFAGWHTITPHPQTNTAAAGEVHPDDFAPGLFDLNSILNTRYKPSRLERAEEHFGNGIVSLYEMAVAATRRIGTAITEYRAYVARTRAEAAAASRYDGFATVSVMIERASLGIPDYTA